jgi:hypothetical protein
MDVSGQFHTPAVYPQEKSPSTHWIGDWVGPKTENAQSPWPMSEPRFERTSFWIQKA